MRIKFSNLSTKSLGDLANRTLTIVEPFEESLLKDNPLVAAVVAQNNDYQNVVIKRTYSGLGNQVIKLDELRDVYFRLLRKAIVSIHQLGVEFKVADAKALLDVFSEVGSTDSLSDADRNVVIQKLMAFFDSEEYTLKLTALNLTGEYAVLKKAQSDFEAFTHQQTITNSDLRQMPSASALRRGLELALKNLYTMVGSMKDVPAWADLYYDVNQVIQDAKNGYRQASQPGDTSEPTQV